MRLLRAQIGEEVHLQGAGELRRRSEGNFPPRSERIRIAAESPFHPQGENGNRTISPRNKGGINIPPIQLPHLGLEHEVQDREELGHPGRTGFPPRSRQ